MNETVTAHDPRAGDPRAHDPHAGDPHAGAVPAIPRPNRFDLLRFLGCYAVLTAVWFVVGKLVVASDAVQSMDVSISEWFVRQRTTTLDHWTSVGSSLASTEVKVVLTAVVALTMWLVWRRWTESTMLVLPLVLEASVFITVTWLVHRPRPDVPRLEGSPVDSSFPSGHVAAAAVYGALAVVVAWHTRKIWIRIVVGVVAGLVALAVALSRVYRGMHFFTDVVAGAVLGLVAVVLAWWMVRELMRRGVAERHRVRSAGDLEGTPA